MLKTETKLSMFATYFPKDFVPKIAIVLGTRLSGFTNYLENVRYIDFSEIKGFPVTTGYGHIGRFALGYINDIPIIVSDGRFHFYEGLPMDDVVLNVRLMRYLGAEILIETNISGIINSNFNVGDIMIIKDHISFLVPSPLIGHLPRSRDERFVNMHGAYDIELSNLLADCTQRAGLATHLGTYAQVGGPNYESIAEVKALSILGADVVGMSTACEVIVAKQIGMRVCGISYLSNVAGENIDHKTRINNLKLGETKATEIYTALLSFINKIKGRII